MTAPLSDIRREASAYGFFPVTDPNTRKVRWHLRCACGHERDFGWGGDTSPDLMVKNMRNKGWQMRRAADPVCPSCQKKEKKEMHVTKTVMGPDPKIARRIYAALDDHFDDQRKLYASGWSDEKVAKEIGTSLELVTSIRREACGELAEDPEMTKLKDDIGYLRIEFEEAVSKLSKDFNARQTELEQRLGRVGGIRPKAAG